MQTREKNYEKEKEPKIKEPAISETKPLQISTTEAALRPLKSTLKKLTHNPNSRVDQNYNIVEDLAQAPCAMSALEVQHNAKRS